MLSRNIKTCLSKSSVNYTHVSKLHTTSIGLQQKVVTKNPIKPKVPLDSPLYSYENLIKSKEMQIPKPIVTVEDPNLKTYTKQDKQYLIKFENNF